MRITMRAVYIMLHVYYMAHLNKLNKVKTTAMQRRATSSIFNGEVYLRHNANYVDLAQSHGY